MWVDDATKSFEETVQRGAVPVLEPEVLEDENGRGVRSAIETYGDTIHTFIERKDYRGVFMPGFVAWDSPDYRPSEVGLRYIDHCAGNVYMGENEQVCGLLRRSNGISQSSLIRRQGYFDRVYSPHVQGHGEWK